MGHYMYSFIEGQAKKESESVVSFVYDCLVKKMNTNIKEVVFLSDACGVQNRNLLMVKFEIWLVKKFSVDNSHIFPVRGHSFNQCDTILDW